MIATVEQRARNARHVLGRMPAIDVSRGKKLVADVAAGYGLTARELCGLSRHWRIARARALAAFALRSENPPFSYPEIGALLGGRDHSTVIAILAGREELP